MLKFSKLFEENTLPQIAQITKRAIEDDLKKVLKKEGFSFDGIVSNKGDYTVYLWTRSTGALRYVFVHVLKYAQVITKVVFKNMNQREKDMRNWYIDKDVLARAERLAATPEKVKQQYKEMVGKVEMTFYMVSKGEPYAYD